MFTSSRISVTTQNSRWSNQPETQPEEAETSYFNKQSNIMRSTENRPYSKVPLPEQTQNLVGKSVSIPHSGSTRAGFALLLQPNKLKAERS